MRPEVRSVQGCRPQTGRRKLTGCAGMFWVGFLGPRQRVKRKDIMFFSRQMAATLAAGLLVSEGLRIVAEDMDNHYFSDVLHDVITSIESGSSFSQALQKHPDVFDHMYSSVVRAGESVGSLAKVMGDLARYLEESERLREKVGTALRYPLFVVGFAVVVILIMTIFLIPRFVAMFERTGAQLPLLTRIVVGISDFMVQQIVWVVLSGIGFYLLARWAIRLPSVKFCIDDLVLKLPLIGREAAQKLYMSRFCRTLGFLLAGGLSVSESLEIVSQTVNNIHVGQAVVLLRQRVVAGQEMSTEIRRQKIFSNLVGKMVSVGERSGRLPEMLSRTADYYDAELDYTIQRLLVLVEPILIVLIGGVVLLVVLALYLPIFNISSAIRA